MAGGGVDVGRAEGKTLVQISGGGDTGFCAVDTTGTVYCWGANAGNGSEQQRPVAGGGRGAPGTPMAGQTIRPGHRGSDNAACAVARPGRRTAGEPTPTGTRATAPPGSSNAPMAVSTSGVLAGEKLVQVTGRDGTAARWRAAGVAYCWGDDVRRGTGERRRGEPQRVPAAVEHHHGAVGQDADPPDRQRRRTTPARWRPRRGLLLGPERHGEFGNETDQVPTGRGDHHRCSVRGTLSRSARAPTPARWAPRGVFCWGCDAAGRLGNNSTTQRNGPLQVDPAVIAGVTATAGEASRGTYWTPAAWRNSGSITGYTATASPGAACPPPGRPAARSPG